MAEIYERKDVVSGIWKFRETVSIKTLGEVVSNWIKHDGIGYIDIHIRKCSRNQYGIVFQYLLTNDSYESFFERTTDRLKLRFGNDFVGWDVTTSIWKIR